ncbi:MAG: cyclic nucleotide-binding domain-containing protein [Trueperaceae bacterium]
MATSSARPQRARREPAGVPTGVAGVAVMGVMHVVRVASLFALVYAGTGADLRADGLAYALIGTSVASLWLALRHSIPGVHAAAPIVPAAMVAVALGQVRERATSEAIDATILTTVTAAALVAGVVMLVLALTGAARLVRYLPHPVIGGMLAGSGWLLVTGAVGMMAEPTSTGVVSAGAMARWLPGVAIGIAMLAAQRLVRHPLVLPVLLLVSTALFYAVAALQGHGVDRLSSGGWLLGPFPDGPLWRLPPAAAWFAADLQVVVAQLPTLLTAALVAALLAALYGSAVEVVLDADGKPGADLRETSVANLLGAVFAGFTTTVTAPGTSLATAMGVRGRVGAAVAPVFTVAVLAFGATVMAVIPLAVLGGLVVYMGAEFLLDWVVLGARRLRAIDLAIVVAILLSVAVFGLLPGMAVGLAMAVILFVVLVARTDVVAQTGSLRSLRSRVTRRPAARALIDARGDLVAVFRLAGHVFFGTADALVERVRQRLAQSPTPRFVVLDVSRAGQFDATGGAAVARIARSAAAVGAELLMVGASPSVRRVLARQPTGVRFEGDLDHALEACENALLADAGTGPADPHFDDLTALVPGGAAVLASLVAWFEEVHVPAGEVLVRQGDDGDRFWLLAEGRVSAIRHRADGTTLRLETLGPGRLVGEIAFVTGVKRGADLVADERSRLYGMDRETWRRLSEDEPSSAVVMRDLLLRLTAERVQHLSSALADA